jgi:hypothetical protein
MRPARALGVAIEMVPPLDLTAYATRNDAAACTDASSRQWKFFAASRGANP